MATKKAKKESKKTTVEIVVKNAVNDPLSAIEPEKDGSKYMVQQNWISESQVLKMLQKTPKEHTYTRPGKGGGRFTYVTGVYVKKVLNFIFGWNWDFDIISHEVIKSNRGDQIVVLGKLTVKDDKGHQIVKSQFGRADVKYFKGTSDPVDFGNDLKAAATDALKKCASELGIASDIYGMNEFKEIGVSKTEQKQEKLDDEVVIDCEGGCGSVVTPQVAAYSKKVFNKVLCRSCQKLEKEGKK